jgi:hypothetical protein
LRSSVRSKKETLCSGEGATKFGKVPGSTFASRPRRKCDSMFRTTRASLSLIVLAASFSIGVIAVPQPASVSIDRITGGKGAFVAMTVQGPGKL